MLLKNIKQKVLPVLLIIAISLSLLNGPIITSADGTDIVRVATQFTGGDREKAVSKGRAVGQSFLYNADNMAKISFSSRKDSGVPANLLLRCTIYLAGIDNFPTGSALSTATYNTNNIPLGTSAADCEWFDFDLTDFTTIAGTTYIAVVEFEDQNAEGNVTLGMNISSPYYTDGTQSQCDPRVTPRVWTTPRGEVTYDINFRAYTTGNVVATQQTSGANEKAVSKGRAVGQSFKYNADNMSKISFSSRKDSGVPANLLLRCTIYLAGADNFPTGSALSTATYNTNNILLGTSAADCVWFDFDLTDFSTTIGTTYIAVVEFEDQNAAGNVTLAINISTPYYTDGTEGHCDPRITPHVWTTPAGEVNYDIKFKAYSTGNINNNILKFDDGALVVTELTVGVVEKAVSKGRAIGQSFKYDADNMVKISFSARKDSGVPLNLFLRCTIYLAGVDNFPTGSALSTATYNTNNIPLGTSAADCRWFDFDLVDFSTTVEATYIAVVEFEDQNASGNVTLGMNITAPYFTNGAEGHCDPRVTPRVWITPAGEVNYDINFKAYSTGNIVATQQLIGVNEKAVSKGRAVGQSFKYNADNMSKIAFSARKDSGVPADLLLRCTIYLAGADNFPIGTILSTATYNTSSIPLGTSVADCEWFEFDLTDFSTTVGNTYIAVVEFEDQNANGNVTLAMNISAPYFTDGFESHCDPRVTPRVWITPVGEVNYDLKFSAYTTDNVAALQVVNGKLEKAVSKGRAVGQTFKYNAKSISKIAFSSRKDAGVPSNLLIRCTVYLAGTDNFPTGPALSTATYHTVNIPLGTSAADCRWIDFDLTDFATKPNTTYIAVVEFEDQTATGNITLEMNTIAPYYTDGIGSQCDPRVTPRVWTTPVGEVNYDMNFKVYAIGSDSNKNEDITSLTYGSTFEGPTLTVSSTDGWYPKSGNLRLNTSIYNTGARSLEANGTIAIGEMNYLKRNFDGFNKGEIWSEFYVRPVADSLGVNTVITISDASSQIAAQVKFDNVTKTIVAQSNLGDFNTDLGFAEQFYKITLKLDYNAKVYDLYINGTAVYSNLQFYNKASDNYGKFSLSTVGTVTGSTSVSAYLDDFYAGYIPPLKSLLRTMELSDAIYGNYASWWFTFADINNDGRKDMIMAQNEPEDTQQPYYSLLSDTSQKINCITAIDLHNGTVIWQKGTPNPNNYVVGSDLPLQVYDIDKDGSLEVVLVSWIDGDGKLEIRSAANGNVERAITIDNKLFRDSIAIANLSGNGKEFLLKDRYRNVRAYDSNLNLLWSYPEVYDDLMRFGDTGTYWTTGHIISPKDINNDGKDELMIGHELVSPLGQVIWSRNDLVECYGDSGIIVRTDTIYGHADTNPIVDLDGDGSYEVVIAGGDAGLHVLNAANGTTRFSIPKTVFGHTQAVSIADYDPNIEGLEIYVLQGTKHILIDNNGNVYSNTTVINNAHPLYLRGYNGQYFVTGGRSFSGINFSVNDYKGNRILTFDALDGCPREQMEIADVMNDQSEEVILMDHSQVYVYSVAMMNDKSFTDERRYVNRSLYSGDEIASIRSSFISNTTTSSSSIQLSKNTGIIQTFKGEDFDVDMVGVNVIKSTNVQANLGVLVSIYELDDVNQVLYKPITQSILDTTNISSSANTWINITFPMIKLKANKNYALVFTWTSNSDGYINFSTNAGYANGYSAQYLNGDVLPLCSDLLFKVYKIKSNMP